MSLMSLSVVLAVVAGTLCSFSVRSESLVPQGAAGRLIEHFHMQRVPAEQIWFSLEYTSEDRLEGQALPARYGGRSHAAGSAILLVETARDFSALHRLLTDEVWHFYGGSAIEMLLLYPDGHGSKVTLGANAMAGELPQFVVPHGVWQGSAPRGGRADRYSFAGDQLSPAFDYADFEMGYRDTLIRRYPLFARDITRLTRSDFAQQPANIAPTPALRAPSARVVAFATADVAVQTPDPRVQLQELVGRVAPLAQTDKLSVARFVLAPGGSSGASFNRQSQEVILVLNGAGRLHLGSSIAAVRAGSTVFIPAGAVHAIDALADSELTFIAITVPAFLPEDYVRVTP